MSLIILLLEKIYEHRDDFMDEPIKAYLYVSYPVYAIQDIYIWEKEIVLSIGLIHMEMI